jgi:3D-(3,5/4)-trihydroxycyclohexane-1,2-dione acylhydrolase (decyclizing)
MPNVRMTVAQAIVRYLSHQYTDAGGERRRLMPAMLGIFGHGNVAGLGQALDQYSDLMPFVQGRNEQSSSPRAAEPERSPRASSAWPCT